eukprot:TRINITY_DN3722_c0_g1_i3.p1 TRINITY_DN3722_c0_g1~~TRINITY_DN3722_c0_g1_i3.p1  ORF type:complete len:512 (+),score=66.06 TRINITY_DN3722_c0_g1_i3:230-1765(+)
MGIKLSAGTLFILGLDKRPSSRSCPQGEGTSMSCPRGTTVDKQSPRPEATTEHKSWFQRMGEALQQVWLGFWLLVFSVAVLWVGEKRSAQMESLLAFAQSEYKTVAADDADPDNRGDLVYLTGEDARGMVPIADARFKQARAASGVIAIRTNVEAYQWVEHVETKEETDRVGGGSTTRRTYTYSKEWQGRRVDSSSFQSPASHENCIPKEFSRVDFGQETTLCAQVDYGHGFTMPSCLVEQLRDFTDAAQPGNPFRLDGSLTFDAATLHKKAGTTHYYFEKVAGVTSVGDVRVSIQYVPDCPATIMALQAKGASEMQDVFLPYRLISRGWFGISDDDRKKLLLDQGSKDQDVIAKEDQLSLGLLDCCFCCFICAYNVVNRLVMNFGLPEIYHAWPCHMSAQSCLTSIKATNYLATGALRVLGWIMMLCGLYCLFKPLLVAIDLLPFFGGWLSDNVSVIIAVLCALVTFAVSSVIIGVAYLFYHPRKALLYLTLPALALAGVVYFCTGTHHN